MASFSEDRIFFFGAYDRTDFPGFVSRIASSDSVPNTARFPLDGTDELYSLKLTWNSSPASTLVATVFSDPTRNSGAGAADPRRTSAVFRTITSTDPGTWQSERTVGAMDYGLRLGQVVGSSGFFGVQAARHQDRFRLDPIEAGLDVRTADFTCAGRNRVPTLRHAAEENSSSGGYGNLGGPNNNSQSYRDQLRADGNLYFGLARDQARRGLSGRRHERRRASAPAASSWRSSIGGDRSTTCTSSSRTASTT